MAKKQTYLAPIHFSTTDTIASLGDPKRVTEQKVTCYVVDLGPLSIIQLYVTFKMLVEIPAGNIVNEVVLTLKPEYAPIYRTSILSSGTGPAVHSNLSTDLTIASTATGIPAGTVSTGGAVYLSKKRGIIV